MKQEIMDWGKFVLPCRCSSKLAGISATIQKMF